MTQQSCNFNIMHLNCCFPHAVVSSVCTILATDSSPSHQAALFRCHHNMFSDVLSTVCAHPNGCIKHALTVTANCEGRFGATHGDEKRGDKFVILFYYDAGFLIYHLLDGYSLGTSDCEVQSPGLDGKPCEKKNLSVLSLYFDKKLFVLKCGALLFLCENKFSQVSFVYSFLSFHLTKPRSVHLKKNYCWIQ